MMPAWRMVPPNARRTLRARSMNEELPASNDPTGADRPFDRQKLTESADRTSSRDIDLEGHGSIEDACAVQVDRQPMPARNFAAQVRVLGGDYRPAGGIVCVLEADQARDGKPAPARRAAAWR